MLKQLLAVSTLALATASAHAGEELRCVGTEPFWGLDVSATTLTYSSPEVLEGKKLKITSKREAAGMAPGFATVIKSKHTSLTTVLGECTDGMSDATYSHHAVYEIDGVVLYGCCNAAE